jgi:diaminopimelate decarboxylase
MTAPLDNFSYQNPKNSKKGFLHAENVSIAKLAEKHGTPLYVYSEKGFLEPFKALKRALKPIPHTICFAVKSNSNPKVLALLKQAGAGMDLVSGGELYLARRVKCPGNKIVFSGVGKTEREMKEALAYQQGKGIFSFNVESVEELNLLNSVARAKKTKAPVALRFNPDVDAKTHPYISTGLKKNKFGLERSEVFELAKNIPSNIQLKGLSIHIGSQILDLSALEEAFLKLKEVVAELNRFLKTPISFVDLGGGIGITYKDEVPPKIEDYGALIVKHFSGTGLRILIEPGRTIAGNAGVLITKTLFRKSRDEKDFLVVDAAMNDLMRPSLYQGYHAIIPVEQELANRGDEVNSDVVGPVCESADCLGANRALSKSISSGDLLAILSAGAYGFSMAGTYNSRPKPAEVMVKGSTSRLIRKRETYQDLP